MINISKEKYWDRALSWVDGCTPCSPGCDHCWSASMDHRFRSQDKNESRSTNDGQLTTFNGKFNGLIITHPDRLDIPLKRKKPTVYAVWNDLFHESVPDDFISDVICKIEDDCERHTFLILTKRPQRMYDQMRGYHEIENVYFGLTICNQQEADEKIPVFLQVPGKKFLSIEPMLGAVDIRWYLKRRYYQIDQQPIDAIDAVILGGETGPGARPMHPDWARSVRDQCAAAGVPFFFKGWGAWIPIEEMGTVSYEKNKTHSRIIDMETHNYLPWRE